MKKIIFLSIIFFIGIISTSKSNYNYDLQKDNNKIISEIKNKYHFTINIKEQALSNYPNFKAIKEDDDLKINNALYKISKVLPKFDQEFFNSFYKYNYTGLYVNLTSTLIPNDLETSPSAYSLDYNKKYSIVIDINQDNISDIFCHEIMHNIEYNLSKEYEIFTEWDNLNPTNFYYNYSYTKPYIFNYTLLDDTPNNTYFIDNYAQEDRARIFEKICSTNANLSYYNNLYNKALIIKQEVLHYYPTLQNTSLFQNVT